MGKVIETEQAIESVLFNDDIERPFFEWEGLSDVMNLICDALFGVFLLVLDDLFRIIQTGD